MQGILYKPFWLTVGYVGITFLISIFGPIIYLRYQYKYWLVFLYLLAVFVFMGFGYYIGCHSRDRLKNRVYSASNINDEYAWKKTKSLISISIVVTLVSLILELFYLVASGAFHFGMSNIGSVYFQDIDGSSGIMIFRFATDFFRVVNCTLGFYFFRKLSRPNKYLITGNVLLILSLALFGYGQQKSIGDLVIYIVVAIFVQRARMGKKLSGKTKLFLVVGFIAILFILAYIQSERYSIIGVTASNYASRSTGEVTYDTDSFLFTLFGDKMGFGLAVILGAYLSNGYYGLSLCLQMPFKWTFGVGSSRALTSLLEKVGVNTIQDATYLGRLSEVFGRNGLASWNTIFPWLASDMTFIGVLVYFFFVGYVFAKAWKEVLQHNNAISYMMFSILVIMMFYIQANNQIFHSYGSFVSSWCIIVLWLFMRKKYSLE